MKRFVTNNNLQPPQEWDTPAKLPKLPKNRILPQGMNNINPAFLAPSSNQRGVGGAMTGYNINANMIQKQFQNQNNKGLPPMLHAAPNKNKPIPGLIRTNANNNPRSIQNPVINPQMQRGIKPN